MLISSRNTFLETPRNNILPAIWASFRRLKLTHTVNNHSGLLCLPSSTSMFIRVVEVSALHSFLWLNNISLTGHITICLFIHQLMDSWVVFIFSLLWMILFKILTDTFLFGCVSFLMGIYLEWKCCVMVTLSLIFWGTFHCFPKWLHYYIIPPTMYNIWGFNFLHIFTNNCYCWWFLF